MYESHFGFRRKPFRAATAQSQYFGSAGLQRVLGPISYCLRTGQGIALLTAPAGLGKSTVLRHLVRTFEGSGKIVLLPGVQARTPEGLLSAIAASVASEPQKADWKPSELRSEASLRDRVVSVCQRAAELWGPTVVLIDDAHVLAEEVFHELRFLADMLHDDQPLFRIGLAGTLKLEEKLTSPALGDFGQRVRCHQFLESLRPEESIEYLKWHVESVGGKLEHTFDAQAVEFIIVAADGVPRCLNQLADESLLLTYYANNTIVDLSTARTALESLRHLPLEWAEPEPELATKVPGDDGAASESVIEIAGLSAAGSDNTVEFGVPAETVDKSAIVDDSSDSDTAVEQQVNCDSQSGSGSVVEFGDFGHDDDGSADWHEVNESEAESESVNPIDVVSDHSDEHADAVVSDSGFDEDCDADEETPDAFSESLEDDRARLEELLSDDGEAENDRARPQYAVTVPDSWTEHTTEEPAESSSRDVTQLSLDEVTAVPVFDRHTWNALGREVSVSSPRPATSIEIPSSGWPPGTSNSQHGSAIPIADADIDDASDYAPRGRSACQAHPVAVTMDCDSRPSEDEDVVREDGVAGCTISDRETASESDAAIEFGGSGYPSGEWASIVTSPRDADDKLASVTSSPGHDPEDAEGDEVPDLPEACPDQSQQSDALEDEATHVVPVFGTKWSDCRTAGIEDCDATQPPGGDLESHPADDAECGSKADSGFFTLSMSASAVDTPVSDDSSCEKTQFAATGADRDQNPDASSGNAITQSPELGAGEPIANGFSAKLNPDTDSENTRTGLFRLQQDSVLSEQDQRDSLPNDSIADGPRATAAEGPFSDLFTRVIEGRKSGDD